MSTHQKLVHRLESKPRDFRWSEVRKIMKKLGYKETQAGKTGHAMHTPITLDRPYPNPCLKPYQIKQLFGELESRGQL